MPYPTDRERDRPWVMRTYAGHSSAAASNALYRRNLAKGQTGLSVAFDLPTQTGYDPDHELARGEVGKVGVPISHIGDMRALFDGIPLAEANTSMTINATGDVAARALRRPSPRSRPRPRARSGEVWRSWPAPRRTTSSRSTCPAGTYVFPPGPCLRLITDMVAWTVAEMPEVEPDQHLQLPPAGGRRDAGAGGRVRAVHRDRGARRGARLRPGARGAYRRRRRPDLVLRQRRACGSSRRCARCARSPQLWDEITARALRRRPNPKQRRFRYGVQVNSLGLTEAQPENNVQRIVLEMLGVTLSRGRPGPRGAAAGVERGARPAAAVGPAVGAADAAGAGLRDRPAGVRGPLRRLRRWSRPRWTRSSTAPARRSTGCRRWAARWPPSRAAT